MFGMLPVVLALSCATQGAEPSRTIDHPGGLELPGDPDAAAHPQDSGSYRPLSVEGRVEVAQDHERIIGSSNNLGLSRGELEHDLHLTDTHDSAFLRIGYDLPFGRPTRLRFFGGIGGERIGSHFRVGPENLLLGDPAGTTDTDFDFGLAPAWEGGAEFRLGLGGAFDLAASADYRGGGDTEKDAVTSEGYHYQRARGGLYLGWDAAGGVRPYAGAHYSYYRARFHLVDEASGADFSLHIARQEPVDAAVGVELASGPVVGTVEVDFVGTLTVLASAGIRF